MSEDPIVVHVVPGAIGDTWTFTDETLTEQEDRSYPTEELAAEDARKLLRQHGGGELVVHGADGQIRDKEIIGVVDTSELPG